MTTKATKATTATAKPKTKTAKPKVIAGKTPMTDRMSLELPTTSGAMDTDNVALIHESLAILDERCRFPVHGKALISARLIEQVKELAEQGMSREAIAFSLQVLSATFNDWLGLGKQIAKMVREGEPITACREAYLHLWFALKVGEINCESALVRKVYKASEDDWRAASWMLGRRFPKNWGKQREESQKQTKVEVNVNTGVMIAPQKATNFESWSSANIRQASKNVEGLLDSEIQE